MTSGAVAAVDLGASSGRVMLGLVGPDRLELEEVHRFPNDPVRLPDGLHWDVLRLHAEVLHGLAGAARLGEGTGERLVSVGIDSWAVDYGLIDATGALIGQPYHYRDGRTDGMVALVHEVVALDEHYARTGLQVLALNTIYQLAAARGTPALDAAATMLLVPDLLAYWLTGRIGAEVTNASTTGLLDVRTGEWATDLAERLGLRPGLLPILRWPGEPIGPFLPPVLAETGLPPTAVLTAVGSHDTASAVVAVPAEGRRFAYVSSGTWSLVGVELDEPVLTVESRAANFTNEGGVDDRVRYLRNVMGLWLLQESLRAWERAGTPEALEPLLAAAAEVPPGGPVIDPDDGRFIVPGDMPARIEDACRETGQPVPADRPALVRCILDSLAAATARTVADAARLSGREVDVVHVVGGGARNALLCQLTADACGMPVLAGPVEATAIGNVLVQARAHGLVAGDLDALRALVRATQPIRRYEPRGVPVTAGPGGGA